MGESYLLDTSAILTLTDREDGAGEVQKLLTAASAGQCIVKICSISLMEVFYVGLMEEGEDKTAELIALIKSWPVEWIQFDDRILLQAGRIKATHRLSVADALIAACAKLRDDILVHNDPEFEVLADQVRLLGLPYKKKGKTR